MKTIIKNSNYAIKPNKKYEFAINKILFYTSINTWSGF